MWAQLGAMLTQLGAMLAYLEGYVGRSWGLCRPILRAYVGPCWPVWSQKIRKMGTAKNYCKTQDILRVGGLSWSYVGLSWGYVGPSWGYVGPSSGLCWPILELCWPILGLCWPILGLCWPILGPCWPMLGLCWPILRPMLAHVDPSWATRAEKVQKTGRAKYTVKRRIFWWHAVGGGGSAAGGAAPLSYGEERNAFGNATARGPLAGFKGWRPSSAPPDFSTLHFIAVWAWKLLDGDLLQIYSLCFLKKVHGIGTLLEIDGFFGEQVSSRKLLPRVFPEELLPISTCYFVYRRLCAKTSLCKSFCV